MPGVLIPEPRISPDAAAPVFGPWSCCSCGPGSISHPDQLDAPSSQWFPAPVPGTVASALANLGQWDLQHPPNIDAQDWWYRTSFTGPAESLDENAILCLDGLATLAEVWLNGERLLVTDNMFRTWRLDISQQQRANNELVIGFRSLTEELSKKRPRPRWKTGLVNHQQLRWQRTTLLGRIPGWSPPIPAIGPWREIRLERSAALLSDVKLYSRLDGTTGLVNICARVQSISPLDRVTLRVGELDCLLELVKDEQGGLLRGELNMPDAPLWWPHTHGDQPLFPCKVVVETDSRRIEISCGEIGFRTLEIDRGSGFLVEVNGEPIYCRGACWTVSDIFTLSGDETALRRDLRLARDAGANLLRVGGTMVYECDLFYRLCDELGIMVWQDFMFANMDYPVDDDKFAKNITIEATQQLCRLSPHPAVVIYCGNSEIEQQASMLGMPRELWRNEWFAERLPGLCAELHPGTGYVASTPEGGVLPFHASSGICHYYGVGAYLRSPLELRQADVKFTPECLGFSNIPEPETVHQITDGALPVAHHPKWKQRVPRDTGAGWDFEDVRDHYLQLVYGVDPVPLRSSEMSRYLELSRTVSGEMMARTFSEWRSLHSHNQGALVWFFKDLWPAAGWGIIDSLGRPKAAYYFLKRTWGNQQIVMTDEGLNGLHLHATNEQSESLAGFVEVTLLKEPNVVVASKAVPIELAGRSRQLLNADEILGGFHDVSYAYRFGPPQHDIVVATLLDASHRILSEAFHFVRRRESITTSAAISAVAEKTSATDYQLTLRSDRFLHAVRISAPGYLPDDNYFHLPPERTKVIYCSLIDNVPRTFRAEIEALNIESSATVSVSGSRE
jgi:beta-mannosidase